MVTKILKVTKKTGGRIKEKKDEIK